MEHIIQTEQNDYELLVSTITDSKRWVRFEEIDEKLGDTIGYPKLYEILDEACWFGDLVNPGGGYYCTPELLEHPDVDICDIDIPF
jgi:hypothetical protein